MYCDRPSTLLWFLCQYHIVHCTSRKYMAVSCWGFFQRGRFPKCAEGAWSMPILLPLTPPVREQDVAGGWGVPATAPVSRSMPELWGSRRLGFFPDPLVSPGFQNKGPCLALNILRILKLNALALPTSSISHTGCTQAIATAKFPVSSVNDTKVIDVIWNNW